MIPSPVHRCECPKCRARKTHPHRAYHHQINVLLSRLNEPQRRWVVALEAMRIGYGGKQLLAQISGLSPTTILRGCNELRSGLANCPIEHLRASGGGRPAAEVKDPRLEETLETLLESETAGDPMGRRPKAKRSSLQHLSTALKQKGHPASRPTVAKLLRKLAYSPKANARRVEARSATPAQRNEQFDHIGINAHSSPPQATPSSASTRKKKELIGNFRNAGRKWCKTAEPVLAHDWPQDAIGQAVPYGVYEVSTNYGYVCVGDCFDTPRFAVDAIADWWYGQGCRHYHDAQRLLILADAGGSNGYRSRVWKARLQALCDTCRLPITVCHYPPGCSKWNPIEHRLFSHISLNWAGVPLRSFDTLIKYIQGTETKTGLRVMADLKRGGNETGERVTDEEMRALWIEPHAVCPAWNYTIRPRPEPPQDDHFIFC